ncbi:glycosyltransferase family 4 protein [Hymenobacter psychrotolerans]|uniref:Glycosyltransferase involved in cell wall bisynthesis n=1 Tax=Hymenobacter psychrotolerans DSM 18569 TaxID=1121959 RepID=A0A1M6W5Q5_9BACT|nr:glycosyltransferase family 4 protein [Hymenobacter psychrotolerans]SHK88958.1 Glycosyltransferase involved in cell wall bisynthesis [Hymenobacter psychrotolerans DSM 18569]
MKIGLATPIDIEVLCPYLELPAGTEPPQGLGGSATTPLVQGLLAAGHTVSVYTLGYHIPEPIVLRGPRLTVYVGNFRARARQRCPDMFAAEANQIRQFIDLDQPDIVHAHWGYEFARGALASGRPHLITLHDNPWNVLRYQPDFYRVARLLLKLWVLRRGRHFTAVSPYLAKALASSSRELPIVPNAVLPAPGGPRAFPVGPGSLVSILTGWSELKNASTALRAFQQARQQLGPGLVYWLFGPDYGPGEAAQQWALAHGLAEGVHFAGLVPHEELLRQLPTFDVLLHPSREESFGLTLVEAMQAGLPVVGGRHSGAVPWVLDEGRCGLLTDINSPAAIAAALLELFGQPARYEALSKLGVARVASHFSQTAVSAAYEQLYQQVLGRHQPTARPVRPLPVAWQPAAAHSAAFSPLP